MKCKYCQAELLDNSSVCPECGKDNLKDDLKALKIVALSLVCVVMLVLLLGLIHYGTTGNFLPEWLQPPTDEEKMLAAMDDVIATMGDHKLTNRQMQLYYWMCAYNMTGKADLTKDLSTQIYDQETGKTYQQYFTEEALEVWREVMLLSDAAKQAGYELPEDYQKQMDSMEQELTTMANYYYGMSSADELIQSQFGIGCNYETYYQHMYDYYLGGLYWTEMVEGLEVTEDQINDYFTENEESLKNDYAFPVTKDYGDLVDIRRIFVAVATKEVEDEEGNKTKVQDWDATQTDAQAILDEWLAGSRTPEHFGELAKTHSDDAASGAKGGLSTDLFRGCLTEVDVQHILIFPQGATSSDVTTKEWPEEAWDWAEAEAQKILDEYLAGDLTAEHFGELANAHSQDNNGKVTNGGLYEDVYKGQMVAAFDEWCFDPVRQPGDTGIVKSVYGYHVMYFVRSDNEQELWAFDEARQVGDTQIVKTDDGYMILYFEGSEAAWHRYSRYGAQGELGADMLEQLQEANSYTFNEKDLVLTTPTSLTNQ